MKETIKINLAQRLFDLDEDAYIKLKAYLDSLNQYFRKSSEEAEDILFDIEQRIAELLDEKLQDKKQVVTVEDVDEVINKMGTADDFERDTDFSEEATDGESGNESSSESFNRTHRTLFRDVDNNILGGVCSGLAAYFNVDSIWIRLVFIALFFFNLIGLIIYVILWIIVPPAMTRSQKLRMHGKAVNIGNIEESVKKEFTRVKENISNFSQSESYQRTRETAGEVFQGIGNVLLVILKILAIIIGVGLAVAGLAVLLSLIGGLIAGGFWTGWHIPRIHIDQDFLPLFENITLFSLAVFIIILIPVIAIMAGIIRLLFNLKKGNSVLSAFAWTFWALALVFVIITLIVGETGLNLGYHYKDTLQWDQSIDKPLYLRLDEDEPGTAHTEYYSIFGRELIHDKWNDTYLLHPQVEIEPSNDQYINVEFRYSALIPWDNDFRDYTYHYTRHDSLLVLDDYWPVDDDEIWRLPRLKIIVQLPESGKIHLDRDFQSVITRTDDMSSWPDWYYESVLVMKDGHLTALNP